MHHALAFGESLALSHPATGAREEARVLLPDEHATNVARRIATTVIVPLHTGAMSRVELPTDRLWSQREAAYYLGVSARYLRDCGCPKVLLPGNGAKGQPLVRYDPADVKAWKDRWNTRRVA